MLFDILGRKLEDYLHLPGQNQSSPSRLIDGRELFVDGQAEFLLARDELLLATPEELRV
jgi:hypothetical protein